MGAAAPGLNYAQLGRRKNAFDADMNGDGWKDLVIPNITTSSWTFVPGLGQGHFGASTTLPFGSQPTGIAIGDWNGDKLPDVATNSATGTTLGIFLQQCK